MSNPYFRCKQFTIYQDRCAMKVGTDGMVLGSWVDVKGAQRILDVGTGTGLLALMLAQRSPASIDAVELEGDAAEQARENVARSPWCDRIQVHHASVQHYATRCQQRYDLLVCNPPFFSQSSPAISAARAIARHSDALSPTHLLQAATQLLHPAGRLAVIYPPEPAAGLDREANRLGWFCGRKLYLQPRASHPVKRIAMELSRNPLPEQISTLLIYQTHQTYTADYIALMQNFYLKY